MGLQKFKGKRVIGTIDGCVVIYYIKEYEDKSKEKTFSKPMVILVKDKKGITRFKFLKVK